MTSRGCNQLAIWRINLITCSALFTLVGCSSRDEGTMPSATLEEPGSPNSPGNPSDGMIASPASTGTGANRGSGPAARATPAQSTQTGATPTSTPGGDVANVGDVPSAGAAPGPDEAAAGAAGAAEEAGAAGSAGASEVEEVPDVACDPADSGPEATEVQFAAPGEGPGLSTPTGAFKPVMESDPGIPTHTVIRPDPLGEIKHPILAWGEGGCGKNGNIGMFSNLFMEFASHGILVIADGPPGNGPTMPGSDAGPLLHALEWAIEENERPCSKYYHKLDVTKLAVSGQSCGGLMAIQAATDPRITTAFPYNSGLFSRDQSIYDALHAPMAIFDGGSEDIAYQNGLADFNAIENIPILFGNPTSCSSNAHVCTFFDEHAGEFGRAGVAWMRWHLLGDQGATGKGMFIGDDCGMCGPEWTLQWKNAPM